MIEQQKKKIEADTGMDPAEKEKVLRMLNEAGGKKIDGAGTGHSPNPESKKAKPAGISQKILTDAEVGNLVQEMIKKLQPQITGKEKEFVNTATSK